VVTDNATLLSAGRAVLQRGAAFWSLAVLLCLLQFAASAPSPLYSIYQHNWHFSPIVLTAVYAMNSLALLTTLLFVGSISDQVGRRPVLAAGAVLELASMAVFAEARGVAWLFVGRMLQGIANGAASGAVSAMLIDLQRPGSRLGALMTNVASSGGIALGALGAGLLVQFAPAPTHLVFIMLIVSFGAVLGLVALLPETVKRGAGRPSLRPRVALPTEVRGAFLGLAPALIATWALTGLYLSLGPSIVGTLTHSTNHLVGASVIVAFNGTGVVMAVVGRAWTVERALYSGSVLLTIGVCLAMSALATRQTALFFAGTVIAGAGFGPSFSGALRTLTSLAPVEHRAEVVAAIYVASYLGASLPAIAAGIAVAHVGLFSSAYGYGVGVIVLVATAALASLRHRRPAAAARAAAPLAAHHELAPCPGGAPALARAA
jgi:predicted MFS family arabinose efflux permease